MAFAQAQSNYDRAMGFADDLVSIHKALNPGQGRRRQELALNRAMVVITVAAWQALVQDLAKDAVLALTPPPPVAPPLAFTAMRATALSEANRLNTPNAENARRVLLTVGFDPWGHWTWKAGPDHVTPAVARTRMNDWLQVRHAIAHGEHPLPTVSVLPQLPSGEPTLRRAQGEACMSFFRRVARRTMAGLATTLGLP